MIDRKTAVLVVPQILAIIKIKKDKAVQNQGKVEICQLNKNINLIIINITMVKEVLWIGMININMKNLIIMINQDKNKNIKVINMKGLGQVEDIMKIMITPKIGGIIKEVIILCNIRIQ